MSVPRRKPPADAAEITGMVPFHDVDVLRIVWHGHYYKYLEVARTALFIRSRIDGPDLIATGFQLVIARSECHHVSPLTYCDQYRVRAWYLDFEQRINVGYEVWNVTRDERAARARTELVTIDPDGKMLYETPNVLRDRIRAGAGASEGS